MPRPRLLHVLGGGPWQVPTVRRAKALGHAVLVTDYFTERPAYAHADVHEVVDIRDRERTLDAARRHGVDGVLCDTTDMGVVSAAHVAASLGLPGLTVETALRCTDKGCMRVCAERAGIVGPAYRIATDLGGAVAAAATLPAPLVVKPADNQSGRGVAIVRNAAALPPAYRQALPHSASGRVLVERFVDGVEYIVDGFVVDGAPTVLGIAAKTPYADNPTIAARILYLSGGEFDALHARLAPVNTRMLAALGLRTGAFHAEYIVDAAQTVPIDVAARGGGVMIYSHAVPHVAGVDVMEASIRAAMDERVTIAPRAQRRGACIEFFRMPVGVLERVDGVADALAMPGVAAVHFNAAPGTAVGPLRDKDDRPGFIVALAESSAAAAQRAAAAKARLRAVMRVANEPVPVD